MTFTNKFALFHERMLKENIVKLGYEEEKGKEKILVFRYSFSEKYEEEFRKEFDLSEKDDPKFYDITTKFDIKTERKNKKLEEKNQKRKDRQEKLEKMRKEKNEIFSRKKKSKFTSYNLNISGYKITSV